MMRESYSKNSDSIVWSSILHTLVSKNKQANLSNKCLLSAVYIVCYLSLLGKELWDCIMIERGDIVEDEKCTVNSETRMHLSP